MIAATMVVALGLLGGTLTAYAEEGDFNYLDAWNGIHGNDVGNMQTDTETSVETGSITDQTGVPETTDADSDDAETAADINSAMPETTDSAEADITQDSGADADNSIGDYISSDVTIRQNASPDLNIDFSMKGGDANNTGLFTPDGNLTLVDDLDTQEASSLQYMTVQTKNGTTFYIIIDRTADKDNVYFLNPVDAADLMALMDDDTKAKFQTDTEALANANNPNAGNTDKTGDGTDQGDKKEKKANGTNPLGTLLIFLILGGGGAAAYYFFKIKPQKEKMKNDDDDLEFEDDEEYVMEDYEPDEDDKEDSSTGGEDDEVPGDNAPDSDGSEDAGGDDADDYGNDEDLDEEDN